MTIKQHAWKRALFGSVLAAIGASLCCVAPLVLLALGISGAWIGSLTALEPYRPIFVGLALLFLGMAFHRLHFASKVCVPGSLCADPRTTKRQRLILWTVAPLLLGFLAAP